ncbi:MULTISPECIES: sigma-70 family RNA polymerase sigma factor [unclassified Streptomyces]|uniref:sigma-70 family RNA polymerase sigma factor n=1 Tax=unclassified Streptomyces TaxID=2593676 RepID=UPI002257C00D|nr:MULTISPECIES: sigma-70 family RNA polymerase sigma factor [unclassified Streptomyces]MCX5049095.1 sigma-70 family RNA polymerase sigma factor [Streptomyces sp. NBC_00474]MCX5056158.1 sigma-70 family RNA polymerase sigma factor [Streptomyces sp. NBC_00452]MCX5246936.1 sigma-70 family RNA polymerase sigma factor [Streptomyces sp. NBC_00201]MCX5287263.1 sigma-70 family RNA polymerase sigma factor [Streptomyces sp. NBC_00183]
MNENGIPAEDGPRKAAEAAEAAESEFLARRFESHRSHLRAVAYRMLGSSAEADDAVQEAWFRLSRSDTRQVDNLGGWLTTVVGRVCLDMLRSRKSRAEEPLEPLEPSGVTARVPDAAAPDPEQDALLADSVGVALLVVLEALSPAERLAFVLHDLFAVSYEEVGDIVGRSPVAARQLASRARRRVQGADAPDADLVRQREVVDAFLSAAREGDFEALVELLDPDVVARTDVGVTTGAQAVARGASSFAHFAYVSRPALVGGATGLAVFLEGRLDRALSFTFVGERIAVIEIVTDPERVARLDVSLV